MKHYLVTLGLHIGEYEKESRVLVIADTRDQAEQCALLSECHCTNTLEWSNDLSSVEDDCGGMIYTVVSLCELTDMEYSVMKPHLATMIYNFDELMKSGNYAETMQKLFYKY